VSIATKRPLPVAPLDRLPASSVVSSGRMSLLARRARGLLSAAGGAHDSDLTSPGAPLEVAFVWPADEVRLSLDPCPGQSAPVRVAACREALTAPLSPEQLDVAGRVVAWQYSQGARYGAWLGLRSAGDTLRSKLYLEVPAGCSWSAWEAAVAGAPPVLPSRAIRLTMVGLDVQTGAVELYYRCRTLFRGELDTLLRRFRLDARGAEVVTVLEALTRRSVRFELPSHDMGFSCSFAADGRPQVFTWYSTSAALLGSPGCAREAILRMGLDAGWSMASYEQLTACELYDDVPCHGLVGAVLADGQPLQLTATVAATVHAPSGQASGPPGREGADA
jgi:hypothetical protein